MEKRIKTILKVKDLTSAKFADEIGIQRSSVSHVLSGRNKPSMDFIQKILQAYPDIHAEWLLLGKGPVTKGTDLFSSGEAIANDKTVVKKPLYPGNDLSENATESIEKQEKTEEIVTKSPELNTSKEKIPRKKIISIKHPDNPDPLRIILIHEDGTFEVLKKKQI